MVTAKAPAEDGKTLLLSGVLYSICSGGMLVANKAVLVHFPCPTVAVIVQLIFAATCTIVMAQLGVVTVDRKSWRELAIFSLLPLSFAITIVANQNVLVVVSVGTSLSMRCAVPLVTSVLDVFVLGHSPPTAKSAVAMGVVVLGAVISDVSGSFQDLPVGWVAVYVTALCTELMIGGWVTSKISMTTWTRVFWNNLIGALVSTVMLISNRKEWGVLMAYVNGERPFSVAVGTLLAFSSFCGLAITYTAFDFRVKASPTLFGMVGNVNKILALFVGQLLWHADSAVGIAGMLVALVGASLYRQAPKLKGPLAPKKWTATAVLWLAVFTIFLGNQFGGKSVVAKGVEHLDSLVEARSASAASRASPEQRVGICFTGRSNYLHALHSHIAENVIAPLGEKVDVFAYFPQDERSVWKANLLNATEMVMEKDHMLYSGEITHKLNIRFISEGKIGKTSKDMKYDQFLQQVYALSKCFDMVAAHEQKLGFKFDWLVRARADLFFYQPLPHLDQLDASKISLGVDRDTCPKCHNDRFAMGPRDMMEKVFKQYEWILDHLPLYDHSAESITHTILSKEGISSEQGTLIYRPDILFGRVRAASAKSKKNKKTNFQDRKSIEDKGLYVARSDCSQCTNRGMCWDNSCETEPSCGELQGIIEPVCADVNERLAELERQAAVQPS
mmetsp:Transcript_23323/g.79371  ORF Transcript_23323/g.79371 Transcript_23323/m.79371 type:complete len:673 (+) Transcript_23323:55-2073(+)